MQTRLALFVLLLFSWLVPSLQAAEDERPNIFLAMADDWGYPFAGVYGDEVVKTPTFDSLARGGVLFTHAYVSSPSCTPSRGAIMTGQYHWRLEEGANLWSTLRPKFRSYAEVLRDAGYEIGCSSKSWGPGKIEVGGRTEDPMGPRSKSFAEFMKKRTLGKPFCFWLGSVDPHRPYDWQSGAKSGMDLKRIKVPGCLPDNDTVRNDIADYLWEVQRFDSNVGEALDLLKQSGELKNTLVMMTGDHGMPSPRGKSNLYDFGTHVPLAIQWEAKIKPGRTVTDFVSFVDIAPTILAAAGVPPLAEMTGHSLLGLLTSDKAGRVESPRDHVIYGKERHVPGQEKGNMGGYPSRGIRTDDYLYIRNFKPDRWPAGTPDTVNNNRDNPLDDCDDGPTKQYLEDHKNDPAIKRFYDLAFAKRPAEELYDLKKDPDELTNVAGQSAYADVQKRLSEQLTAELRATADPRILGGAEKFDEYPFYGSPSKK